MPRYVPPRDGGMGMVRPSAFFFRLASNAFPNIRSVGRIKKKLKQKHHKKSRNRRPWHPKMTLKVNIYIFIFVFVSVFLYAATMLIFQIKRINYCKWKMVQLRLYFFFFFINAKNLGLSDDAKRRKNEDGLTLSDAFWWWEMNWFKFPRFQDDSVDGRPLSLAQLKIFAQNAVEFQHDHPDRVRSFHFWSWRTKNLS